MNAQDINLLEKSEQQLESHMARKAHGQSRSVLRHSGARAYPLDALPDTIRAAVEEVVGFVKAPIPLVASSALSALSLACQAHIDVKRAEGLQGPVGLFC